MVSTKGKALTFVLKIYHSLETDHPIFPLSKTSWLMIIYSTCCNYTFFWTTFFLSCFPSPSHWNPKIANPKYKPQQVRERNRCTMSTFLPQREYWNSEKALGCFNKLTHTVIMLSDFSLAAVLEDKVIIKHSHGRQCFSGPITCIELFLSAELLKNLVLFYLSCSELMIDFVFV